MQAYRCGPCETTPNRDVGKNPGGGMTKGDKMTWGGAGGRLDHAPCHHPLIAPVRRRPAGPSPRAATLGRATGCASGDARTPIPPQRAMWLRRWRAGSVAGCGVVRCICTPSPGCAPRGPAALPRWGMLRRVRWRGPSPGAATLRAPGAFPVCQACHHGRGSAAGRAGRSAARAYSASRSNGSPRCSVPSPGCAGMPRVGGV